MGFPPFSSRDILVPMSNLPVPGSSAQPVVEFPPLTADEDTFCLGVVEYGGNLIAAHRGAFGDMSMALARAHQLLGRPEIAKRIQQLHSIINEHALVSLGSHLVELATIRDLAKTSGQLRTAFAAEVQRGKAAGFYDKVDDELKDRPPGITINMPRGSSLNIGEWAARNGKAPVVIENGNDR